jgi:hypothetical protein
MAARFEIPGSAPVRPLSAVATPLTPSRELTATIVLQHVSQADLDQVLAFARESGLQVADSSIERRSVKVSGTTEALDRAFGIALHGDGEYVSYSGPLSVPANLSGIVLGILGLDNRPIAHAG